MTNCPGDVWKYVTLKTINVYVSERSDLFWSISSVPRSLQQICKKTNKSLLPELTFCQLKMTKAFLTKILSTTHDIYRPNFYTFVWFISVLLFITDQYVDTDNPFTVLTLLAECQEGHLACEHLALAIPKVLQLNPEWSLEKISWLNKTTISSATSSSVNRGQLDVPHATLSSCGVRAFAHAGPSLWNTLPVHLKSRNLTLTTFMCHLNFLSLISFLSTDFVSSAFGVWSHNRAI